MFRESFDDFFLFVIDVDHDVEFVDDVFDLSLKLSFRINVEKWRMQVRRVLVFELGDIQLGGSLGPVP